MPVKVIGPDGAEYQFPDGTDKAAAIAYFKKKGIGVQSASPAIPTTPQLTALQKMGQTFDQNTTPVIPKTNMEALRVAPMNTLKRVTSVVGNTLALPYDAAGILRDLFSSDEGKSKEAEQKLWNLSPGAQIDNRVKEALEDWRKSKSVAAENALGDLVGMYLTGKATSDVMRGASGVVRSIPKAKVAIGAALTDTTPGRVAEMVKKTSEENAAQQAKADAANVEAEAARKADLKKHFEKTSALKEEKLEAQKDVSGKEAAKYGVEKADEPLREDLTRLKEKEHAEASNDFDAVKEKLQHFPADMERLNEAWEEQASSFGEVGGKGATGSLPPVLTKIGKIIERGDTLTYKDEQLLYTELGSELSKGTLQGPTYNAYDKMQDAIGEDMQRIADSQKIGPQLKAARVRWTNLKKTFYDRRSPVAKALKAKERGGTIKAFRGADRTGIEAIARYDPSLARRLASTRDVLEQASTPVKPVPAKALPKLAPKPPKAVAKTTTLSPAMLEQMKDAAITKSADQFRSPNRLASTFLGYDLLRNAFDALGSAADFKFGTAAKQLLKSVRDVGIRVGYSAGAGKIADLIEKPEVRANLSKLTPEDIREIGKLTPAQQSALGAEFKPLIEAAKKKNVPVSPSLTGWVVAVTGAGYIHTAKNAQGHTIGSNDGTNWFDQKTGAPVHAQ